jgi:hypothetical protein
MHAGAVLTGLLFAPGATVLNSVAGLPAVRRHPAGA